MDKTVPAGAALLLDFIYRTETDRDPPECYEVIYGFNQNKLPKKLTAMTLDEVEAAQPNWTKRFGSSAAGAGQFMRNTLDAPRTLRDIEGEMGLTGREKFSPSLQDRMAYHLLKRRGYLEFVAGTLSATAFGNRLAMEWASFPVLSDIKGQKRKVTRGQSYYAGDGVNKALTKPENVEAMLDEVLAVAREVSEPAADVPAEDYQDAIAPAPTKRSAPSWLALAVIVVLAVLVGVAVFFGGQVSTGEEVSLLGPPQPHPRPFGLMGEGGNIWAEIGMQVALSFVAPLVSAAATAAVGWIAWQWQRVLKADFDQKSADMLHGALERGMLAAIDAFGARSARSAAGKTKLLEFAADYAATNNPAAVKHFKLGLGDLERLAVPHLVSAKAKAAG